MWNRNSVDEAMIRASMKRVEMVREHVKNMGYSPQELSPFILIAMGEQVASSNNQLGDGLQAAATEQNANY